MFWNCPPAPDGLVRDFWGRSESRHPTLEEGTEAITSTSCGEQPAKQRVTSQPEEHTRPFIPSPLTLDFSQRLYFFLAKQNNHDQLTETAFTLPYRPPKKDKAKSPGLFIPFVLPNKQDASLPAEGMDRNVIHFQRVGDLSPQYILFASIGHRGCRF